MVQEIGIRSKPKQKNSGNGVSAGVPVADFNHRKGCPA